RGHRVRGREGAERTASRLRYIKNAPISLLQHGGQQTVSEFDDGFVVEVKHLKLPTEFESSEFSAKAETSIIDEQIDWQVAIGEGLGEPLPRSGRSQIHL